MLDCDIVFDRIDDNGTIRQYRILETFEKNNKKYLIYKEDGNDDIYSALFNIVDDKIKIIPITNNSDYDVVDEYLESL